VIHTLIIDFFSHGLRSVKIEQELEKRILTTEQKQKNDIFCDISSKQFSIQVISCVYNSAW
jgi:hypothetical protein